MRIQLNVPQAYDVVVMLDKTELRFNKKNKKITKQLSSGNHKLQVRQVNMLATSIWPLNIILIIIEMFGSFFNYGESKKLESVECPLCISEPEQVSFVMHYGNHRKIEIVSDDPLDVKRKVPSASKMTKIERRWLITNIIAISLAFSVVVVPCILMAVDAFKSDTLSMPAAKVFFPGLAVCFIFMAVHTIYKRIKYEM